MCDAIAEAWDVALREVAELEVFREVVGAHRREHAAVAAVLLLRRVARRGDWARRVSVTAEASGAGVQILNPQP